MVIKFPVKLLIWKPFKVNLEFIEIELSCINLESIQKQSRLDRNIAKGTTDPGVDYLNQLLWFGLLGLV